MPADSSQSTSFEWLPWLLQVNDSQFPSGAYAHSMGLEELTQRELIRNPEDLERFLHQQILPGLLAFELPFLARAHAAAAQEDLKALRTLDDELEAWKLAAEMRQASRQLGSRRLALIHKLDPASFPIIYASPSENGGAPCHHLIICALELRALPVAAAAMAFGYQTISGYCVASMKLIRMGQERSQLILRRAVSALAPRIEPILVAPPERIGWFNPLLEISSMRHARAHERLFIS
ncbi:MAG: urease accessory protein UreF [Candidatus Methylacidiphilales bacterium]